MTTRATQSPKPLVKTYVFLRLNDVVKQKVRGLTQNYLLPIMNRGLRDGQMYQEKSGDKKHITLLTITHRPEDQSKIRRKIREVIKNFTQGARNIFQFTKEKIACLPRTGPAFVTLYLKEQTGKMKALKDQLRNGIRRAIFPNGSQKPFMVSANSNQGFNKNGSQLAQCKARNFDSVRFYNSRNEEVLTFRQDENYLKPHDAHISLTKKKQISPTTVRNIQHQFNLRKRLAISETP